MRIKTIVLALVIFGAASLAPRNVMAESRLPVVLLAADFAEFVADVSSKLALFGDLDIAAIDVSHSIPSLDELSGFRAALVWSDMPYKDSAKLGDVLADYADRGGGVVVGMFSWTKPYSLQGRYIRDGYGSLFGDSEPSPYRGAKMGKILEPSHSIVSSVKSLTTASLRATSKATTPGARVIVEWDDGSTMLAIKEQVGSRTVDIGYFPPSSDACTMSMCLSSSWDSSTDGARILHNALVWAAGIPPVAPIGLHIQGYEGSYVTFDLSEAYDPDGYITSYEWDLYSDGVFELLSHSPTMVNFFGDDFRGDVRFRLTDNDGLQTEGTVSVDIMNIAPSVGIASIVQPIPNLVLPGDALIFTGEFVDRGIMDTHAVSWIFGDGYVTYDSVRVSHVFEQPGDYLATLVVRDDDGGAGEAVAIVRVMTFEMAARTVCSFIVSLQLQRGIENSLMVKCSSAASAFADDRPRQATNHLVALRNEVLALEGKKMSSEGSGQLVKMLNGLLERT